MQNIEIIGLLAAALTTSSFIPQVYKVWKQKSARDISLSMYLTFVTGIILWLIYGIQIGSPSLILANIITFVLTLAIIVAKLKYK